MKNLIQLINLKQIINPAAFKNRFQLMKSYYFKRQNLHGAFPSLVHIELTNYCNLRCIMCPLSAMKRKKGAMNLKLFKKIITELSHSPVELVCLSFYGESLLNQQFPQFLSLAKSAKLNIFLSTNGLMLSQKLSKAIINNPPDLLIISYDTSNPNHYRQIRKGGNLAILNNNIKSFLKLKGKNKPLTVLQCIDIPNFPKAAKQIRQQWADFDVVVASRPAHNWLGDLETINQITQAPKISQTYGVCDQPWRHAVIYWDGRVGPCCNFYDTQLVLGDLNTQSLKDIWNNPKAQDFRKLHTQLNREKIKLCATCQQKAPNLKEKLALTFLDMNTINTYLSSTDGWRDNNI